MKHVFTGLVLCQLACTVSLTVAQDSSNEESPFSPQVSESSDIIVPGYVASIPVSNAQSLSNSGSVLLSIPRLENSQEIQRRRAFDRDLSIHEQKGLFVGGYNERSTVPYVPLPALNKARSEYSGAQTEDDLSQTDFDSDELPFPFSYED